MTSKSQSLSDVNVGWESLSRIIYATTLDNEFWYLFNNVPKPELSNNTA